MARWRWEGEGQEGPSDGEPNSHPYKRAIKWRGSVENQEVIQTDTKQEKRPPREIHDWERTYPMSFFSQVGLLLCLSGAVRLKAQATSEDSVRILGHHQRPLTCLSLVLCHNSKFDSAHVRCGRYRLPDHCAKRRPVT